MSEVKFHTKPTQINRKNPILIYEYTTIAKVWAYPLDNGYIALFMVHSDTISTAVLGYLDDSDYVYNLDFTKIDIHTRQDLVDFVKNYNKMTKLDMLKLQQQVLKKELLEVKHNSPS